MYILEKFQKKGAGTYILDYLEDICKKNEILKIKLISTDGGLKFYKKNGFKVLLSNIMEKNLK